MNWLKGNSEGYPPRDNSYHKQPQGCTNDSKISHCLMILFQVDQVNSNKFTFLLLNMLMFVLQQCWRLVRGLYGSGLSGVAEEWT